MPLPAACADLVACSLGPLQDSVEGLAEARRLLRPGGRLVVAFWDEEYVEWRLLSAARARLGLEGYPTGVRAAARDRAQEAGFRHLTMREMRIGVAHRSVADYLEYRRSFGVTMAGVTVAEAMAAVEAEAAGYADAAGRVVLDWTITVLTAVRPATASSTRRQLVAASA